MPAIQPARLKKDASRLAEIFPEQTAFLQELEAFCDYYADRVQRPGSASSAAPILTAYNLAPPVLRQLLVSLAAPAAANPAYTLTLTEKLWARGTLEHRLVAGALLGAVGPGQANGILTRLGQWIEPDIDEVLLQALLRDALGKLPPGDLDRFLTLAEGWLNAPFPSRQTLGLRALNAVVELPQFQNIPRLLGLLAPLVRSLAPNAQPALLELVDRLARRTPEETAHFLLQNYRLTGSRGLGWLIRQTAPSFPTPLNEELKNAAKR